jgi:hypothetical protein
MSYSNQPPHQMVYSVTRLNQQTRLPSSGGWWRFWRREWLSLFLALEDQDLFLDMDGEILINLGYGRWEEAGKEQGKMRDSFSEK